MNLNFLPTETKETGILNWYWYS